MLRLTRWILVLSLALYFFGVGSCAQSTVSDLQPEQPVEIHFWHYYAAEQEQALNQLIETFNRTVGRDKQITVTSLSFGSIDALSSHVLAAVKSGEQQELPHLLSSYPDAAWELIRENKLVDLKRYMPAADLAVFPEAYLVEGRVTGGEQIYLLPLAKASEVVFVNQAAWQDFAQANHRFADPQVVFASWESLAAAAHVYQRWTRGEAMFGLDSLANFMIIGNRQLGVELFKNYQGQSRIQLEREAMYQIWQIYYISMVEGGFAAYGRFRSEDLNNGRLVAAAVSTSAGPYILPDYLDHESKLRSADWLVLPYPVFADGQPFCVQQGAGLAVMRAEEDEEIAAAIFLHWLTRPEQNVMFSIPAGYLPVTRPALQSQLLQDNLLALAQLYPDKPGIADSLETFLGQIDTHELYAPDVFDNSFAARGLISYSLRSHAEQARQQFEQELAAGEPLDTLYDRYINDIVFEQWYSQLVVDLERLMP